MDIIHTFINVILHLDQHLLVLFSTYGTLIYALLFAIIFCETGLVVTPFLPGDSLLFATGALAAQPNTLNIHYLFGLLFAASVLGNTVNFVIGRYLGPKIFNSTQSLFFNRKHVERAHQFYATYGGKTIIIARFIPIIRTFAPLVAGIGQMGIKRFTVYNLVGGLLWIGGLLYISYFFGSLPFVKEHFSTIILGIIVVSLLPPAVELLRLRLGKESI